MADFLTRLLGNEFSMSLFLGIGKGCEGVILDEFNELAETRTAPVVGRFEEPFKLLFAKFGVQPALSMRRLRAYSIWGCRLSAELISAIPLAAVSDGGGREFRRAASSFERLGWEGGIKLGDESIDRFLRRISEADQDDLGEADVGDLFLWLEQVSHL